MDDKAIEAETPETYRSYPNGWYVDEAHKWSNLKPALWSYYPKTSNGAYSAVKVKKTV